ncbi:tetratricopeptide repeat protein, partial [Neisseria sp. 23W00734]
DARRYFQEWLECTKKLSGDKGVEEQANAQSWLGRCYFKQALQIGNAALFDDARRYFQEWLECTKKLSGDKGVEEQANAQLWLGCCYFEQALQ